MRYGNMDNGPTLMGFAHELISSLAVAFLIVTTVIQEALESTTHLFYKNEQTN